MKKSQLFLLLVFTIALSLALQWGWSTLSGKPFNLIGGILIGIGTFVGVVIGDRWRRKGLGNG